jgi:hypothetical protein
MGYHFREQDSFVRIVELTPAMRKQIEATIEHLLSVLDQFDGDENLEDDGCDEPWLSSGAAHHTTAWRDDRGDDRELNDEDDEDGGDLEPTLGAPERHPSSWEFAPFGVVCREPGPVRHFHEKSQEHWTDGLHGDHEREEENEHGGNILDEPHDEEEDCEQDYRDCEFA